MKTQISELKDVASLFHKELSKIQDAESSLKQYLNKKLEDSNKNLKEGLDKVRSDIEKWNQDTYKELDNVDKEMQKLKQAIIINSPSYKDEDQENANPNSEKKSF